MPKGTQKDIRLEDRLVLLAWLNSLLGYKTNRDLLEDAGKIAEGFGADGHSFLYHHLIARGGQVKIPVADLARYDENIRQHLDRINRGRTERITLRYFQYLAALYTEIFLDRLFNGKDQLLADLNQFVRGLFPESEGGNTYSEDDLKKLTHSEDDLKKLAYWMATGSGKTLLLHLNYYQFLHYNRKPLDNILLVTPNEGLSEQHLRELAASGIPARWFSLSTGDLWSGDRNTVQVIEITKLVEEKKGAGESVPVEAFKGYNLIFVDEGHKGSSGEAWRSVRNKLGETGFTFEYSATFSQALSAAKDESLTNEYAKAIVFDYSYRYFYGDGFGKDFRILNLKKETQSEQTYVLLLGNLLAFYQQLRLYEKESENLRPYNLEKPLLVFLGSTVNAVYTEKKEPRSDVLTVVCFLRRVLGEQSWAKDNIEKILSGNSGLRAPDGRDVFAEHFPYLKGEKNETPEDLYKDILKRVFHTEGGGGLHLFEIKSSPGEIGLKAANAKDYFGVISIGDIGAFKGLLEGEKLRLEQDAIAPSLFTDINRPNSRIHVLIGAKKFIEGWNSWRVASMGLLNIGQKEGAQIIQLFGRGVRLKGKDMSLKRSSALEGEHPPHIHLLETLNIFAVRAGYMAQFRDYLKLEGVEVEPRVQFTLPVSINLPSNWDLMVPRAGGEGSFAQEKVIVLEAKDDIDVYLDLSAKVQVIQSKGKGQHATSKRTIGGQKIPPESLRLLDWEQVYLDLLTYKNLKGLNNLIIPPESPCRIMKRLSHKFELVVDESVIRPQSFADRARLQQAVTRLLCRYIDKVYQKEREKWEEETMIYQKLDENDSNLTFLPPGADGKKGSYVISIPSSEGQLIEAIQKLLADEQKLRGQENGDLPRLNFDRHLYIPLLLEKAGVRVFPPALTPSEKQFVGDLKKYWEEEKDKTLKGKELFLLRNLSRGRGIGFFEERGFYPDFILWVVEKGRQCILFIEPHGMLHAKSYINDDKARLWERLKDLEKEIGRRSGRSDITLDSFIISATPYDELRLRYEDGTWTREQFAQKHILFPEQSGNYHYIQQLLSACIVVKAGGKRHPDPSPS